jgi:hypothetical protein
VAVFNELEAWFTRKLVVLRNLEAKLLKMVNLRGLVRDLEPGLMLLVYAENTTHEDRLVL